MNDDPSIRKTWSPFLSLRGASAWAWDMGIAYHHGRGAGSLAWGHSLAGRRGRSLVAPTRRADRGFPENREDNRDLSKIWPSAHGGLGGVLCNFIMPFSCLCDPCALCGSNTS